MIVAVLTASLLACSGMERKSNRTADTDAALPSLAATADSFSKHRRILSWEDAPEGVHKAIARMAPDFTPWTIRAYTDSTIGSTRTSADAGLSIARGRFRSAALVDFVVLGYDKRLHGLRIIAALFEPATDAYNIVSVSDGPERADSLAARPDRFLELDSIGTAGRTTVIVRLIHPDPGQLIQRFTWDHARGQFLLVTPD